jgi:hypothetical protein
VYGLHTVNEETAEDALTSLAAFDTLYIPTNRTRYKHACGGTLVHQRFTRCATRYHAVLRAIQRSARNSNSHAGTYTMEATLLLEKEFPFSFCSVAVEPDRQKIMVGCGDGKIRVINGDGSVCHCQ